MKGTRPLDNNEIRRVADAFDGIYATRNRALFVIGVSTGGRVSELLSLKVDDVYQNNTPVTDLLFDRAVVKGGEVSRAVPINADGRDAIETVIGWHTECFESLDPDRFLFPSRQSSGAIDRRTAHEALKKAFNAAGLNGKLATHSMRKSFAQRLYDQTADIFAVQEMLGHKNVATTQRYLGVNYATLREAVEKMAFSQTQSDINTLSTRTLKTTSDHALFLELALRGYDLAKLRDNEKIDTPAEIIKLGERQTDGSGRKHGKMDDV